MKPPIINNNNEAPFIIGIAGESGVGKSTLTEVISLYYGIEDVTILSTDDLHKWERNDPAWDNITHLNPDANNLFLGDEHLKELSQGNSIYRSVYNHKTGKFNEPIQILPQKIVINEGLHAYYTDFSKKITNLKIFVNTDEDLRVHWKIVRDTQERGYTYEKAMQAINKRKKDGELIKNSQINSSDIIINLSLKEKIQNIGDKDEEIAIDLNVEDKTNQYFYLCKFIKNYFLNLNNFIKISESFGNDIEYCQDTGGNISFKISDEYLLIKSSGYSLKNIFKTKGFSVFNFLKFKNNNISSDFQLNNLLSDCLPFYYYKKPSMETGFHAVLDTYIIHLHPIYITFLLCLEESIEIIKNLYSSYNYQYVEYSSPGFYLYEKIKLKSEKSKIYFLENHGIIVSSNNIEESVNILKELNNIAKNFIINKNKIKKFKLNLNKNIKNKNNFLFPDAVIFNENLSKKETLLVHDYIIEHGPKIGNLRYLKEADVLYLKNLESEKYRKSL